MGYMNQTILTCFLVLQLSQHKVSSVLSGAEALGWHKNVVEFVLPVNCKTYSRINIGDDFLQSMWLKEITKGNPPRTWEVKVIRKIVREDEDNSEFECY